MKSIIDIINRIKKIENVNSEYALSKIFNKNQGTITNWKKRNIVPYELLYKYCDERNISFNWLLSGKGNQFISSTDKNNIEIILDKKTKNLVNQLNKLGDKEKDILINSFIQIIKSGR